MNLVPRGAAADDKESIALRPSFLWSAAAQLPLLPLSPHHPNNQNPKRNPGCHPDRRPAPFAGRSGGPWQDLNQTPAAATITSLLLSSARIFPCPLRKPPRASSISAFTPSNPSTPSSSPKPASALPAA